MSIYHPAPSHDKTPHCATGGCPNPATMRGTLRVHDEVFRDVAYCTECAGFLYEQFEAQQLIPTLRSRVIEVMPLPGETMTVVAYERITNDLLLRGDV